jgi:PAS domain S-box-containing protein
MNGGSLRSLVFALTPLLLALVAQGLLSSVLPAYAYVPFYVAVAACAAVGSSSFVLFTAAVAIVAVVFGFAPGQAREMMPPTLAFAWLASAAFALHAIACAWLAARRTRADTHAPIASAPESRDTTQRRPSPDPVLQASLDAMQQGIQIIDRDWRYLYINDAAAAHGQSRPDLLLGRTMIESYPGIADLPVFAVMRECMEARTPAHLENHFVYPDGNSGWFELSVQPVPDGILIVSMDITARKLAQADMQQMLAELDSRNTELQEFTSFASHDLQEPLRKIRMFSDRLLHEHTAALPASALDYIRRSMLAAERMQTLIDDLLALTRVDHDAPLGVIELDSVIASALDNLEERLTVQGGKIEVGAMPTLEGDATQLRQVFQNLIGNALKFRDAQRAPVVRVNSAATRLDDGAPAWAITVADNGIGFEPTHSERIFAPFQRLHGRSQYEGTGIGLAIVRRIVERHGGRITASATPGQGAQFTLVLPQRPPRAAAGAATRAD